MNCWFSGWCGGAGENVLVVAHRFGVELEGMCCEMLSINTCMCMHVWVCGIKGYVTVWREETVWVFHVF